MNQITELSKDFAWCYKVINSARGYKQHKTCANILERFNNKHGHTNKGRQKVEALRKLIFKN
jgi:hypothetical protein